MLQECQAEADRAFLLTLTVPLCLAVAAAAYVARPPPQELKDSGQVFEDDKTGFLFEVAEAEAEPERDKDVGVSPVIKHHFCSITHPPKTGSSPSKQQQH